MCLQENISIYSTSKKLGCMIAGDVNYNSYTSKVDTCTLYILTVCFLQNENNPNCDYFHLLTKDVAEMFHSAMCSEWI